ncbi:hypothetical protein [Brevibacterium atlanticum]|uniref:hypothetical protein n=1 Tax=Brevibacterium atlanticum TaxID=2697563 RepID=UPI00141E22BB|nr:hypothetical protein [Brevibacterium atlanticum]
MSTWAAHEQSVRALAWLPDGTDTDRLFPSQLGTSRSDPAQPGEDVFIAEALSTRYFANLSDAQVEKGNVPVEHRDSSGERIDPAVDDSVYVGIEARDSTGSPFGLIWYSLAVIPETDWPLLAPVHAAIADPATVETATGSVTGTLTAADIDPPVSRMVDDGDWYDKEIIWFPEWHIDVDRYDRLLDSGGRALFDVAGDALSTARSCFERAEFVRPATVTITPLPAGNGHSLAVEDDASEPGDASSHGGGELTASGFSIVGEASTISFLRTDDTYIEVIQTGSQRTPLERLWQLPRRLCAQVLTRPRR